MATHKLIGRHVKFLPGSLLKKDGYKADDVVPVRAVITFVHPRHGWFRAAYKAGDTVLYECFKLVDIGEAVTLLGRC